MTEDQGTQHSPAVHVDPNPTQAPADAIIVSDAHLLFYGDFTRSGVDLVLSEDGREVVLRDYFKGEKRAALASPDGAHLNAHIVDALTGQVHLSQAAGAPSASQVIGHVTKLQGSASVVRNGVSIILNVGDNVEKGDVVQSGSNSSLGITFIDGTVFGLAQNARMVLNEMVYDPNGSNNSSLLTLIAGTITFVAGETAKHGDMKVDTPVATMGIRGTAVLAQLLEIDFNVPTAPATPAPGQNVLQTPTARFQVLVEPDGTTGSYILFDKVTLQPIAVVNQAGVQVNITNGVVTTTQSQLSQDIQKLILDVFTQKFTQTDQNTKVTSNQTDSINPLLNQLIIKTAGGIAVTANFATNNSGNGNGNNQQQGNQGTGILHIDGAPEVQIFNTHAAQTTSFSANDSFGTDMTGGTVAFQDINTADRPTVSATFGSYVYLNAQGQTVSSLSPLQLAGIKAAETDLALIPGAGNTNNGATTFIYGLPDSTFSFLGAGEKLILAYSLTVNSNYAPNPESTTTPITITVTGTPAEAWIHTTTDGNDNLWTTGQNWKTGHSPVATDDVFIVTNQVNTSTPSPSYPAIVAEGTKAVANSVTMNDLGDLPPQLDIASGASLAIGTALTLSADSILNNAGTVAVNGLMELLDNLGTPVSLNSSLVINSGTLNLGQGGDFQGLASITNTGTIDLEGGTLNVLVNITNSPGDSAGQITIQSGATLALGTDNNNLGVTGGITGGTLTTNGAFELKGGNFLKNGTLVNNNQITVTGIGNGLHNEDVTTNIALEIFDGGALTIDLGSNFTNTALTVDSSGELIVNGSTVSGGTITNSDSGTINLTGSATLKNGALDNSGNFNASSAANVLDGMATTNSGAGAINVNGVLTLQNAASITNSLSTNTVTVEGTGSLTLFDTSSISGGKLTNLGTVSIEASTGAAFHGVSVDNTGGTINVDANLGPPPSPPATPAELILDGGTTILGGKLQVGNVGKLDVAGTGATLSGVTVNTDVGGVIKVEPSSSLGLVNSTFNGGELSGAGTIATLAGNADSILNSVTVDINTMARAAAGILDLTGTIANGGEFDATTGALHLENVTINGGTLGGNWSIATADANTDSTLNGVTIANGTTVTAAVGALDLTGTITNGGELDATTGALHLENVTINGGTLGGNGSIATSDVNADSTLNGVTIASGTTVTAAVGVLDLTGTITNGGEFDATTGALHVENVTIDGGTLGGNGPIATADANTDSTLNGIIIANGTTVTAAVGTLDLTGIIANGGEFDTTTGALQLENVTINGGTLGGTIANGTTVTAAVGVLDLTGTIANGGEFDATTGALHLENVTINGGTLGGNGSIATSDVNTNSILNGVTIASGATVTAAVGVLDLTGTIANGGEFDATTGALHLENATINGGTLGGNGSIATSDVNTDSTLNGVTIANGTTVTDAAGVLDLTGTITATGAEVDANGGPGIAVDLKNVTLNGGTLGGSGKIGTANGNTASTLNGVALKSGTKVTAAVGTLHLTGTIAATGAEIDANSGAGIAVDLESVTLVGVILGGLGTIATVSGANTLNDATISDGTTVKVADNTELDLVGTIANAGTIALASSGDSTQLRISGGFVLTGGGQVTLTDNANNFIVSDGLAATLSNFNTIGGAGTIGDSNLTLMNSGTIDATGSHPLIIDTGADTSTTAGLVGSFLVTNNAGGVLEALAGHTLQIDANVLNNGLIQAGNPGGSSVAVVDVTVNITGTGSIEIFNNAKLEIGGSVSSGQTVTFGTPGGRVATAATLTLDDSHDFHGTIVGLTENPNESLENVVDLKDLKFVSDDDMRAYFSSGNVTISNGTDSVTLKVSGNSDSAFELAVDATGGTLLSDPPASGTVTIDSGKTLDISTASAATVNFTNGSGTTGDLVLDSSKGFTGQIVGFSGDGTIANSDLIDLSDINIADVVTSKTTYTDNGNGTGTLTLYNANGQALDSINFVGQYQLANFTIENDGGGHTLIVDPPISNDPSGAGGQSVGGTPVQECGYAPSSTTAARVPSQMLTGFTFGDNFAFNFGASHNTLTDIHPDSDTLQVKFPNFANVLAALSATHDDSHSIITVDSHDVMTLSDALKAQAHLHANDFHII